MSPVLAVEIWVAAALLARAIAETVHIVLERRVVAPRVQSGRLVAKTQADVRYGAFRYHIRYAR